MNPDTNQTPAQAPVAPSEPVPQPAPINEAQAPVASPTPVKKTPMEMIGVLLAGIKEKLQKPKTEMPSVVGEPVPAPMPEPVSVASSADSPAPKKLKIPKKVILIVVLVIVILIILMLVMSMIGRNGGSLILTPSPSATPTSTPTTEVPSQYADDEDVAQIKAQMEELNKKLNESSFRDETLRIPTLDWNVNFED